MLQRHFGETGLSVCRGWERWVGRVGKLGGKIGWEETDPALAAEENI